MYQGILIVSQLLLAVIYFSAGLSKLLPWFPNIIGPVWLIDELAKYNLALFGYFIAIAQAVVGGLLFLPRFRLAASLMLLPMHLCITVIPISLGWQGTPIVNGLLLIMLLALLFDDRHQLKALLLSQAESQYDNNKRTYWLSLVCFCSLAAFLKYGTAFL
ncbi:hypothetical protein [uncultured Pseudoteredinibacter sp.]|uniref:hypothetical protein n=1 Tax=uncultured Pseudoteredinibacter sp. TaxID=1641701 RepID=UPI00263550E0|nr:hypothetical protein [uncultured Pseudoteredinibacter sp.]